MFEEVMKAVKSLKSHKAPGEDGLPPELYKAILSLVSTLPDLLKKTWKSEYFPQNLRDGTIIPELKKVDRSDCKTIEASRSWTWPERFPLSSS
jgi:hypothetical protein